jgi:alpha-beta hydrolase superfamily lysophospholipase
MVLPSRLERHVKLRAVAFALVLAAGGATGCSRFFFFPDSVLRVTPDQLGLEYRDVAFASSDGVRLHGWLLPARGEAVGTIVFLHGNAQNISAHIASVYWLPATGFHVFLFDYRGYGISEGRPTLDDVHRDAEAALRRAVTLPGVDPARIAVFGQSLGGAIAATAVASVRDDVAVRALVLDSAFSDFRSIAREKLAAFWLTWPVQAPLAWTISDKYRPAESLARLHDMPVLIVQGDADDIVSPANAERLRAAAGPTAEVWLVPGAGHIAAFQQLEWRERLCDFLVRALRPEPPAT